MTRCVALATRVSDPVLRASVCLVAVAHTTSHPVLAIDRNTRCFRVLCVWGLPDTPSAATGGPGATTAALERGVHGAGSPHGDALGGNAMWHCTARVLLPSIIPWKPLINIGARTQLFASAGNVTTAASACTWCMCDALALRGAVSHATRGASAFCLGSRHALVGRNWVRASYPHRHVRGCVHRGECTIVATCRPTRRGCRHRHWRELLGSPGVGTPSLGLPRVGCVATSTTMWALALILL